MSERWINRACGGYRAKKERRAGKEIKALIKNKERVDRR